MIRLGGIVLGLALLFGVALQTPAFAHDIMTNTRDGLLENCTQRYEQDTEYEHHLGVCIGYIKGVANAWYVASAAVGDEKMMWCLPERDTPSNKDLIDIVVRELRAAKQDLPSALLVIAAFKQAYPCTASGK